MINGNSSDTLNAHMNVHFYQNYITKLWIIQNMSNVALLEAM